MRADASLLARNFSFTAALFAGYFNPVRMRGDNEIAAVRAVTFDCAVLRKLAEREEDQILKMRIAPFLGLRRFQRVRALLAEKLRKLVIGFFNRLVDKSLVAREKDIHSRIGTRKSEKFS